MKRAGLLILCGLSVACCGEGVLINPVAPRTSGSGSTSAGGTSSSGSASGGTTGTLNSLGCFLSDGGSILDLEFGECSHNSDCPCPLACVQDPDLAPLLN